MRLGWYAGVSTALAGAVVISAFQQRANFYSAMVYLAQSNFCLLAIVNFILLLYSSLIYGLTKLCYGTLRAVEVEQLTERAWFAITETCLAMTIFREDIGAWFLVMFTALVTGKVWGWIGDGRVEFLEQQPPANPRLFHLRLSISLSMSFIYDIVILRYTVKTVIQQARPNMMVMFLFEYAILAACSWRTGIRYLVSVAEQRIVHAQTQKRLVERRLEIRQQREEIVRERERAFAAGEEAPADQAPLPSENDVDEMDIEVPGWAAKGEWVLWLDLITDMIKLGIYVAFFFMLLRFYGLPIHIMRDLFMTTRDFLKRLHALLRYRRAIQEMNRYPDATAEELSQDSTCIICREDMQPWDPVARPNAIDRVRPKKLPCGHVLHLGCLKSWLERQQVCPTCRSPVTMDRPLPGANRAAAGMRIQIGGAQHAPLAPGQQQPQQQPPNMQAAQPQNGAAAHVRDNPPPAPQGRDGGGPRIFNLGPIRLGFGAGGQQARELVQQFGLQDHPAEQGVVGAQGPNGPGQVVQGHSIQNLGNLLQDTERIVQQEMQNLQATQQELQVANLLVSELHRLRQRRQLSTTQPTPGPFNAPGQGMIQQYNQIFGTPSQPDRVPTPSLVRHSASANSPAIPAGSPELPDGVTLPPGWSLIPLQRLDGQQTGPSASTQQAPTSAGIESSSSPHHAPSQASQLGPSNSHGVLSTSTATHAGPSASGTLPNQQAQSDVDPAVVAQSPVAPQWGGPAQLFSGQSVSTASQPTAQVATPGSITMTDGETKTNGAHTEDKAAAPVPTDESAGTSSQPGSVPQKGKAKAVTVEDENEASQE